MRTNNSIRYVRPEAVMAALIIILVAMSAFAMPPNPNLLDEVALGTKVLPYFATHLDQMHAKGICTGVNVYASAFAAAKGTTVHSPKATGNFYALAVMVQFSDNPSATPAVYFDSLLFDSMGITVNDYYKTISYGQLDMVTVDLPSSVGWLTAPQTYAYYVNNQNATGSYPHNSQTLVEDLVTVADPSVDFSKYDNDGNGLVDVLLVIHSGPGAEKTGDSTDIWSHSWAISPKLTNDGVYVSSYTIQPEYLTIPGDMTIGVFAHELGHAFGLPDLYDTDYSSGGVGKWCIMSFGSWLGPGNNGSRPAEPCAWSRIQLGFTTATNVSSNIDSQAIPDVKSGGQVFRLWTSGAVGNEYFLVENREKTGYDTYLPGQGLLIWHIDDAKYGNDAEWYPGMTAANHYQVALEQADGLYDLEHYTDLGDGGDVWPGSTSADTFNTLTLPNSNSYLAGGSFVAVENISAAAPTMYANFKVAFVSGTDGNGDNAVLPNSIDLHQNYPNPFNPTTTISFNSTAAGKANLQIFNIVGARVRTLVDGDVSSGTTDVIWDGRDDAGDEVASGIYLYRLSLDGQEQVKKMMLVR